jgi:hypothetical protein
LYVVGIRTAAISLTTGGPVRIQRIVRVACHPLAVTSTFPAHALALMLLALSPRAVVAQAQQRIIGIVVEDSTLLPIAHAELWLLDEDRLRRILNVRSDSAGRFVLAVRRPGHYAVRVRRLGFEPTETPLYPVRSGEELALEIRMATQPQTMPAVITSAPQRSFMLDGFEHRRARGFGTYFTREDIVRRGEPDLADLVRDVAGINVISTSGRQTTMSMRSGSLRCQMVVFVDGVQQNKAEDHPNVLRLVLESLPGSVLEGVEVYKGRSQLPAEFGGPEVRCGAIVAWTRGGGLPANEPK